MDENVALIKKKAEELITAIDKKFPDDTTLNNLTGRWHDPAINGADLSYELRGILEAIESSGGSFSDSLPAVEIGTRLDHLKNSLVPNIRNDPDRAVASFMATINAIKDWLSATATPQKPEDMSAELNRERKRIRAISARIDSLGPRSVDLESMLERIEAAHQAADELPTDLQALEESRDQIKSLTTSALTDAGAISTHLTKVQEARDDLDRLSKEAANIIAQCQRAYSAATSVGLAAAFDDRASQLRWTTRAWVLGLVLALVAAFALGGPRLSETSSMLAMGNQAGWRIALSIVLSLLSLGAPIWFAWIATRQAGQSFRLAEDYAFKAAVSRAYEGYRSEAARVNEEMEAQLLASALSRLDEQPLRLVEPSSPSSPLAEILQSDTVRSAAKTIPGFVAEVKDLAARLLNRKSSPTKTGQPSKELVDQNDAS